MSQAGLDNVVAEGPVLSSVLCPLRLEILTSV